MNEEKAALRKTLKEKLRELPEPELERSDAEITARVLESKLYRDAERVFLYYSQDREVSTRELLQDAVSQGKTVALPVAQKNGEMNFFRYTGILRRGMYGIMEPISGEILVPAPGDILFIPALCYDRKGYRLGHGGGYYDRYLLQKEGISIGLCRDMMWVEKLPVAWHDIPVEYVFTERGIFQGSKKSGASSEAPQENA